MIFRWSLWGDEVVRSMELLQYSIATFRKQFGNAHEYIVYTDQPHRVVKSFATIANVQLFPEEKDSLFNIHSRATWRKWCPSPRLDVAQDEFFVDSDVFLLKYPVEIEKVLADENIKFAVMDEYRGQPFQRGAMLDRTSKHTPYINAGFFLQKAGNSIADNLLRELEWWRTHVKPEEQTHHDEQGALAIALTEYAMRDQLCVLPKEKYAIISPTSNPNIQNLDDITLFHATHPTHPAFHIFRNVLDATIRKEKALPNLNTLDAP